MFGLLAYPAQGVYESVKGLKRNRTQELVQAGRLDSMNENQNRSANHEAEQVFHKFWELVM